MEIEGTIIQIGEIETVGANNLEKRQFVIETDGDYPQQIAFELIKDKVYKIDNFAEGQRINVLFNIRGREWNGKYYTNLQAWKLEHPSS